MAAPRIYLDHAATTPILPQAQAAMAEALARWANPSSPHADGRAAKAQLERARATIADALGWRHDVIFTSGASEALAIAGQRARVVRERLEGGRVRAHARRPRRGDNSLNAAAVVSP